MEQNTIFLDNFCATFFSNPEIEKTAASEVKISSSFNKFLVNLGDLMIHETQSTAGDFRRVDPFLRLDIESVLGFLNTTTDYTSEDNPVTLESLFNDFSNIPVEEESTFEIISPFRTFEKSYQKFFSLSTTLRVSRYV